MGQQVEGQQGKPNRLTFRDWTGTLLLPVFQNNYSQQAPGEEVENLLHTERAVALGDRDGGDSGSLRKRKSASVWTAVHLRDSRTNCQASRLADNGNA